MQRRGISSLFKNNGNNVHDVRVQQTCGPEMFIFDTFLFNQIEIRFKAKSLHTLSIISASFRASGSLKVVLCCRFKQHSVW